jgi:mono/diheme cytochrome c family protein
MQMKRRLMWSAALMTLGLVNSQIQAQQIKEGLSLAKFACAHCHAIDKGSARSPNPAAPRFVDIANTPGMSAMQISTALQTAPHRTMPNVRLNSGDLNNLIGYILSLKRAPQ